MKLSALSLTAFLQIGSTSAGCPLSHLHESADGVSIANPHIALANQHSLQVHKTPLVHFKIPPKDRHHSSAAPGFEIVMEGGVLVEKKKKENKDGKMNDDRDLQELKQIKQEWDLLDIMSPESTLDEPSYSNQNVGDGFAKPVGGYSAVRQDVIDMVLTNNQAFWPADILPPDGPNYSGLLIRLAWHCAGTYRTSDGRGGCDGAAIRFPPESNWKDNKSLDEAMQLLIPIKEKHGDKLSWGDLIVIAADAAIISMGGPVIGFCGGRIDFQNGDQSLPLGPSSIQQKFMPCGPEQCPVGEVCPGCELPLGTAAQGLMYVNAEGTPVGEFEGTADNIREVFARMGFNDRMTVAAIGGGHAFGKCHGPCIEDEIIETFCPDKDTNSYEPPYTWEQKYTSGLEVTWTTTPTSWDNEFFNNILDFTWANITGPGGRLQWEPEEVTAPNIQMLTTDLALVYGDAEYRMISQEYATNLNSLTADFGTAWYQLMTRDTGNRQRCLGDELPPIQPWELAMGPLGPLKTPKPDYIPVRSAIQKSIDEKPSNIAAFATLASQCATTFRSTDYLGGCNGAAIRYSPSIDWPTNTGAVDYLELLEPIKDEFSEVSWSDLIVLAGQTAIEAAGGYPMPFCGGRSDSDNGDKSIGLEPRIYNNNKYDSIMYDITNKGLSLAEGVALMATPDPIIAELVSLEAGVTASTRANKSTYTLSNQFFVHMNETDEDVMEWYKGDIADIGEQFINDNDYFLEQYSKAYTYLMTADLFDGPTKNACQKVDDPTIQGDTPKPTDSPGLDDDGDDTYDDDVSEPIERQTATPTKTGIYVFSYDDSDATTTPPIDDSAANNHATSISSAFAAILAVVWMVV